MIEKFRRNKTIGWGILAVGFTFLPWLVNAMEKADWAKPMLQVLGPFSLFLFILFPIVGTMISYGLAVSGWARQYDDFSPRGKAAMGLWILVFSSAVWLVMLGIYGPLLLEGAIVTFLFPIIQVIIGLFSWKRPWIAAGILLSLVPSFSLIPVMDRLLS